MLSFEEVAVEEAKRGQAFRQKLCKEIAQTLANYELLNIIDCPDEEHAVNAASKIIEEKLQDYRLFKGEIY